MELYEQSISKGDPRTNNWFLMRSPAPVLTLLFLYLYVVRKGPKLMENHKPFNLKGVLLAYNAFLVLLSVYMFKETLVSSYLSNYSYTCQLVDYSYDPLSLRMANVIWWFFFSKAIELLDTVFFILRKKTQQITFLHVYHHCTMLTMWWVGAKYVPGGQAFFPVMINCLVHTVMYSYYFLSIIGERVRPYLWWKRYLTQMQITQFLIIAGHVIISLYYNCEFPRWMFYVGVFYVMTLTALFGNFYIQTYIKRRSQKVAQIKPMKYD